LVSRLLLLRRRHTLVAVVVVLVTAVLRAERLAVLVERAGRDFGLAVLALLGHGEPLLGGRSR
jgi:hypothetical protein